MGQVFNQHGLCRERIRQHKERRGQPNRVVAESCGGADVGLPRVVDLCRPSGAGVSLAAAEPRGTIVQRQRHRSGQAGRSSVVQSILNLCEVPVPSRRAYRSRRSMRRSRGRGVAA